MRTTYPLAAESALSDLPDRIVVSPGHGRISVATASTFTTEGEVVRQGDVIARVAAAERSLDVCAPCDAWVLDYMVRDGELVSPGSPIAHLRAV